MLAHTARSLLGRNHRKINKEQQNLDYRATRSAPSNRLGGWKSKYSRTIRSYDDIRNLDAAISGVHDKQNTTRIHDRSKKDNTTIQGFRRVTRKIIQEKYIKRLATMPHSSKILKDIHAGVCGHHTSSRAIAAKAFRAWFYWLTAIEDTKDIVRKCEACQRFASRPHAPAAELQPIPLSWPFAQWGLDMVGKLHKSWPGGHVYMLVAVDKFTKWVEAAPVTTQDSKAAINFIKSIVFCFGVPHSIITDNGTNFTSKEFKDYCEGLGIKLKFASVAHPKTNGQVKKANGLICNRIKKRLLAPLEKAKHAWVDELPSVLWSL
jgi:hypothetical protein